MAVVRERIRMPDAGRDDLQRATRVLLLAFITLTLVATNQLFVLAGATPAAIGLLAVREAVIRRFQELPLVAGVPQDQFEHAKAAIVAHFAIFER